MLQTQAVSKLMNRHPVQIDTVACPSSESLVIIKMCIARETWSKMKIIWLGHFPKVRLNGRLNHDLTSNFENQISGFFQEFLLKNYLLRAYI